MGDIYGQGKLYLIDIIGFTITSFSCGIAQTTWFLIGSCVAQGVIVVLPFPQIYTLLRSLFIGHSRSKAFGFLGMTLCLAAIAGQLLGGLLIELNFIHWGGERFFDQYSNCYFYNFYVLFYPLDQTDDKSKSEYYRQFKHYNWFDACTLHTSLKMFDRTLHLPFLLASFQC
ncbi:MFS transporter [Bartonella tamiae]|uniref:Major facilitator superfamily (MFS) profile domain-containing protein n=1 Tax=Bartonella tamiae Th239 TaxID=1094558 RepID=J1K240_9HYPH|nr:MFS transporter [Bartonella tamiae]EJF91160.1 hypothetical protein ME5_00492 [Bartonella tamiae Th239]EJF93175.1 hypothetical protein MEG_01389 [Bartonella tamiae Th307]